MIILSSVFTVAILSSCGIDQKSPSEDVLLTPVAVNTNLTGSVVSKENISLSGGVASAWEEVTHANVWNNPSEFK